MFIENFSRKQKRKFDNLSPREQAPIIESELVQKISPIMAQQIAKSMIIGMDLVWKDLYINYVSHIDGMSENEWGGIEWIEKVNELLSEIRTQYLRIEANKVKEGEDYNEIRKN